MSAETANKHRIRIGDLVSSEPYPFQIVLGVAELLALRDALDLLDLRKARFEGTLSPLGKADWHLTGTLGATVVQPCVATLEPVVSRVETDVTRSFIKGYEHPDAPESEMPEDDHIEALGTHIDLMAILHEALSLALPLYPRSQSTEPIEIRVTEPGQTPLSDDDAKPFAGLAALKDQLKAPKDD